ncbi:hypothetical protein TgHK011_002115 [Trichoderma gracile]|nr:hypothetical protein TgHK011_002115 [Trichoderma gracile]
MAVQRNGRGISNAIVLNRIGSCSTAKCRKLWFRIASLHPSLPLCWMIHRHMCELISVQSAEAATRYAVLLVARCTETVKAHRLMNTVNDKQIGVCATETQRREVEQQSQGPNQGKGQAQASRYGLMTTREEVLVSYTQEHHRSYLCDAVTDPSWKLPLVFVLLSRTTVHATASNNRPVAASFGESRRFMHGARSRLGVSLLPLCRPLAAGPSDRWAATDLLQRLSSLHPPAQPAEEARPLAGTGREKAGHPGRHPGPARLKH